jgi:hypothetical protein
VWGHTIAIVRHAICLTPSASRDSRSGSARRRWVYRTTADMSSVVQPQGQNTTRYSTTLKLSQQVMCNPVTNLRHFHGTRPDPSSGGARHKCTQAYMYAVSEHFFRDGPIAESTYCVQNPPIFNCWLLILVFTPIFLQFWFVQNSRGARVDACLASRYTNKF